MRCSYFVAAVVASACTGSIGGDPFRAAGDASEPGPNEPETNEPGPTATVSPIESGTARRLATRELERSLDALFPEISSQRRRFPNTGRELFDTEATAAEVGVAFLDNALVVADSIGSLALETGLIGCGAESGQECLAAFVDEWSIKILGRGLDDEERSAFLALAEGQPKDEALRQALEALLVHPEHLYHVTAGNEADGPRRALRDHEILAKLALMLWGQRPDEGLRRAAAAVELHSAEARRQLAESMMEDPRAAEQRASFHAQLLGYTALPNVGLGAAMRRESEALIEVATAPGTDYHTLFLSDETWVDEELATHYGLTAPPGGEGWARYAGPERRGILSHGSFLSAYVGASGDASVSKRGAAVYNRLLCTHIELPLDMEVDVDAEPEDGQCGEAFLRDEHAAGDCAGCHRLIDGIGFGLNSFDLAGQFRTQEPGRADCPIEGRGSLAEQPFEGPGGLAELLVEEARFDSCLVRQVVRFGEGRELKGEGAADQVARWAQVFEESGFSYRELLLAIVSSQVFAEVWVP